MNWYEKVEARFQGRAAITAFAEYMEEKGFSPNTVRTRRSCLECVNQEVTFFCTAEELEALWEKKNLSAKSKVCWKSHIHNFYQWAVPRGLYQYDPTLEVEKISLPNTPPRPMQEKDLEKAVTYADPEMRCMLLLSAFGGVLSSEMALMTTEDILHDGWMHIPATHSTKERIIPMHPDIEESLKLLRRKKGSPLFPSKLEGRPLTADEISMKIGAHLSDLNIRSTGASLRHYFAVQTLKACHDFRVLRDLLGRNSVRTAQRYASYDELAGKQAVGSLGFGQRGDGTT